MNNEAIIKEITSDFPDLDESIISRAVKDAYVFVNGFNIPDSLKALTDQATRLYACHLLLVRKFIANDGVISETMGPLSQTFTDPSKSNDSYLRDFYDLLDMYGYRRNRGSAMSFD